ncbi:MAG: type II secretion system protein [Clostridia bacterium]|nr:type II secretion system protein [Clostridia bacterium]
MKKVKSRKGFTLIELVVTVAILSIVCGMGAGIFSMVLRNYGTASSAEQQQEKATQIENYIITAARKANDIKFLDAGAGDVIPSENGDYLFCAGGSTDVQYYNYDDTATSPKSSTVTIPGVQKLTIKLRRQKLDPSDTTSEKRFMYLEYRIEMSDNYTVNGSVVLNNLKSGTTSVIGTVSFVDEVKTFVVCGETSDKAVVFMK